MIKRTLYNYQREDGGYTNSLDKPEGVKSKTKYRLIAENGKMLTDGVRVVSCIDIAKNDLEKWSEIEAPEINESEDI